MSENSSFIVAKVSPIGEKQSYTISAWCSDFSVGDIDYCQNDSRGMNAALDALGIEIPNTHEAIPYFVKKFTKEKAYDLRRPSDFVVSEVENVTPITGTDAVPF